MMKPRYVDEAAEEFSVFRFLDFLACAAVTSS